MNVSNQYLLTYIPGSGWTGYLDGQLAGRWDEDSFEEMLEWKRQYAPITEPDSSKAPGKYDSNDTFERRELTKDELNELAAGLAGKYDPSHMTQEEYDSFLDDLVEEGILSRNQLGQLGYHGFVVLGSLEDMKSGWGGTSSYSKNIMTLHNDPYYQRYGYISSLSDAKGNALAYATMMSWLYPGSGSASFRDYVAKQQSNYEAMANVLEAMQRQRQGLTAGEACSGSAFAAACVSRYTQTGNFQDALTVSGPSARTDGVSQTADPNAILPTDSTEVKLEKLRRIAETADYTGMSYGEIYKTILDRYQQAFDGKFLALASSFVGGSDRDSICHQFANELDQAVYHPLYREIEAETGLRYAQDAFRDYWYENYRFKLGAEALGYGGMSPEEIEKAVSEKYAGKNTLADFAAMMEELHMSGVLDDKLGRDGANNLWGTLCRQLYEVRPEDNYDGGRRLDSLWERAQREPFDLQKCAQELKYTIENNMSFYNYDFDIRSLLLQSLDKLLVMFGEGDF